ncbi:hypothetical protein [Zavarzinia sp. CC-PAN008]|uniref:ATP-binding protein n=1 Tax=Zavarzinia sp. CC-PAN008 TaxID=3243332 RepID=UPI003F745788
MRAEDAALPHAYLLCGWRVVAERPIATLVPWPTGMAPPRPPDISVRFGPVAPATATPLYQSSVLSILDPGEALIDHPDIARIAIRDGRHIVIDARPGAPATQVEYYAFGMGLGVLCHQRGLVPMHASGLDLGGQVLALTGASGAGKSTTARSLIQRGLAQVTDDILAVEPASLLAMPSFPASNLWSDAAAMLDQGIDPAARIRPNVEKFKLDAATPFRHQPLPLGTVVALVRDRSLTAPQVTRLKRGEAAMVINRFIYGSGFARVTGTQALCFRTAAALATRVPVHLLRWPPRLGTGLLPLAEIVLDLGRRDAA